jgi:hypothetical protein
MQFIKTGKFYMDVVWSKILPTELQLKLEAGPLKMIINDYQVERTSSKLEVPISIAGSYDIVLKFTTLGTITHVKYFVGRCN